MVALTLPQEVLEVLATLHPDPAWAIVQLVTPMLRDGAERRRTTPHAALAEIVHLPGRRSLIVVQPQVFTLLPGVSMIPLADGRAFLAMDGVGGIADLELAILDRLAITPADTLEHTRLTQVREILRKWRVDPDLLFRTKSIIVVEGVSSVGRRPLTTLDTVDDATPEPVT
jgi:hypothetical protein